jgi:hypothetical protein
MDFHELGDCVKQDTVSSGPASLFHYPNRTLDLSYVLVGTLQVDHGATWNGFNQDLERCKFTVSMYRRYAETMF